MLKVTENHHMLDVRYLLLRSPLLLIVAIMIETLLPFEYKVCEAQGNYVACATSQIQKQVAVGPNPGCVGLLCSGLLHFLS